MKTFACIYLTVLVCFILSCDAMTIDLTKESTSGAKMTELNHKIKRSTDELDNLLNEVVSLDEEKLQSSPLAQYLLYCLSHITPEKRNIDNKSHRSRLGRRSNDNDQQKPYEPKPYDVFFTPRMGKRFELSNNTPLVGRSIFSE